MLAADLTCYLLTAVVVTAFAAAAAAAASSAASGDAGGFAVGEVTAQQCPCAYLERGGFWGSAVARSLGIVGKVFTEKRCSCAYANNCDARWKVTDKSLTMWWLGSHGISDTEIQLQFCSLVFGPTIPTCSGGASEVAFTLKQVGWWIDLVGVNCRCPGTATIKAFRYLQPLAAGEWLRSQVVDFACAKLTDCATQQSCYQELLTPSGSRLGGRVPCGCPSGTYCPIYKPVQRGSANASQLLCQPEP